MKVVNLSIAIGITCNGYNTYPPISLSCLIIILNKLNDYAGYSDNCLIDIYFILCYDICMAYYYNVPNYVNICTYSYFSMFRHCRYNLSLILSNCLL